MISTFPLRLNPQASNGFVYYMGGSEGCHALPPDVAVDALMAAINKSETTSWGPLADPLWRECPFGAVFATSDKAECICRTSDRPARKMACPR